MFNRIYIEITNICNLNCDFCPHTERIKKSMTTLEFESVILKIKDYTKHIYLHVKGEPLMHDELDSIIKIANKYNLNVNITTNGRLLNKKIDIINNNKVRQINISLHSFNNLDEIKELLKVLDKINDSYISLRLWNNKDNKEILDILESHYNKRIEFTGKRFTLTDKVYLDKDILFEWPDIKRKVITTCGTCKGAKSQIAILVDGTVVPCCLDKDGVISLGNIFTDSFEDILSSDRYVNYLTNLKCKKLTEELTHLSKIPPVTVILGGVPSI